MCSNILAAPAHEVYFSQLIRYSTACGSIVNSLIEVSYWLSWSHFEPFTVVTMTWLQHISVTNDHGYVPFIVVIIRFFPHLWLITGIVKRVTQRMPHAQYELLTLPEHLPSSRILVGFVLQCFVDIFGHCVVCPSIYGIWLPLCYLQTFRNMCFYFCREDSWIIRITSLSMSKCLLLILQIFPKQC